MVFINILWIIIGLSAVAFLLILLSRGLMPTLNTIKNHGDAIKIIFSMFAVVYAAALYHINFIGERVSRTLTFSEKADKEPLRSSLSAVNDHWIRGEGCKLLRGVRNGSITNDQWAEEAREYIRSNKYEQYLMNVHRYYSDVVICADRGRCDQETACQIFGSDIENFRLTYRKFLADWEDAYQSPVIRTLISFKSECEQSGYLPGSETISPSSQPLDYECQ